MADSQIQVDDRVRLLGEDESAAAKRAGTGTVDAVDGNAVRVRWDSEIYLTTHAPSQLEVVTIVCSYAKEKWTRGKRFGFDGMVMLCDIHRVPANGEVYEVDFDKVASVTSRCQGPW